jgi:hypothetical protein
MKTPIRQLIILVLTVWFASLQSAHAVSPAPDGGYSGANTAEGQNALFSLTTGGYNTAVGWLSLRSDTTGSFNTAIGAGALALNSADDNTATGVGALLNNTIGAFNTANGVLALFHNTEGEFNTGIGSFVLFNNMTGAQNMAMGDSALLANTSGSQNIAIGVSALRNSNGSHNVAIGKDAMGNANTGSFNVGIGEAALHDNTTGSSNTAIGHKAGFIITGGSNICIGAEVLGVPGDNYTIRIGDNLPIGAGNSACYIGGIYSQAAAGGGEVFVSSDGKLGTTVSSRRFKQDIKPMNEASKALFALKPVTFRYRKEIDPAGVPQFGLVAEDVEKVSADLVGRDSEGKAAMVRYDQVNAMLLNEFLKEHQTVQELKKQVAELTAGLQKVSAQLELSKRAPQTAENNQ